MNKRPLQFAIVLSGCGVKDGSEIHEAVLTMLAVRRASAAYQCFAPDVTQHHVTNHLTGKTTEEVRNCLVESARIARGDIFPLNEFDAAKFDALIFPGGYGAATNLCTFAVDGAGCRVNKDVEAAVKAMTAQAKPIGALCIAPVILGKLLSAVKLTVGDDQDVNAALAKMGAATQDTGHGQVVIDYEHKIVTAPCYMLESTIDQIADGAERCVKALIQLVEKAPVSAGKIQ